jgi:hypothetical protein
MVYSLFHTFHYLHLQRNDYLLYEYITHLALFSHICRILFGYFPKFIICVPDVVVEWLNLLLRIRKVPGSNLGPMTGYSDRGLS